MLSARPHAGPTGSHPREFAVRGKGSGRDLLDPRDPLEGTLVAPNAPSDSGDAIGEGDGGDVVAAGSLGSDGPGLESVRLRDAVGGKESGTGAVDEEHASVGIAALGDATHATAQAGGSLFGGEAEVVGQTSTGPESADIADRGEESGGREDSKARDGEEVLDGGDTVAEALELVPEAGGFGLEFSDLLEGLAERFPEECGDQVMVEGAVCVGQEGASALGNGDAELSEEPADGIDASGSSGQVSGAKAVQSGDGLLIQRFHGDGCDLLVSSSFQDGSGVGTVGLVANSVASDMRGGKQGHLMTKGLELAPPVVSGATCLHEHMARRPVKKEAPEPSA